jgi:hypothetical protein
VDIERRLICSLSSVEAIEEIIPVEDRSSGPLTFRHDHAWLQMIPFGTLICGHTIESSSFVWVIEKKSP